MSERDETSRRRETDERDEIGSWLLGELSEQERARFEARLARDPALRAEAERLGAVVARLEAVDDAVWAAQSMPGDAADGATAGGATAGRAPAGGAVAGRSAPGPSVAGGATRSRKRAGFRWRGLPAPLHGGAVALACAALLAVGVGAGALLDGGLGDGGRAPTVTVAAPAVVLAPLGRAPAGASADARMDGPNRMVLTVRDLPPAPAGAYYEAWLLDGPGEMVPVASFAVGDDGAAVVAVPLPASAGDYRYLDVSLQHVADGPEHSSDSVLRGRI